MKIPKKIALLLTMTLVGGAVNTNISYADSKVENLVGESRWETAVKVSQNGWKTSDEVIIVNESSIVDALCATPFAKAKNAPILLTQKEKLDDRTKSELRRLNAKKVYIIGGESSISKDVEAQIKTSGISNIVRISGSDRYQTSLELAKNLDSIKDVPEIALVNGNKGLADAVSVGSAAAQKNIPILLSESASKSSVVEEFVKNEDIKRSYVIGGESAISNSLMNSLQNTVRLGGKNRNETNAKVVEEFYKSTNLKNAYVTKDGIKDEGHLIDALTVGVLASKNESPVVIVSDKLSTSQKKVLNSKSFETISQVGGGSNKTAFDELKLSQNTINYTVEDAKELEKTIKKCDANDIVNFKPKSGADENLLIETEVAIKMNIENNNNKSISLNMPNTEINVNGKVNTLTLKRVGKLNINSTGSITDVKIGESAKGITIINNGTIQNIVNDADNVKIVNKGTVNNKPTGSQVIVIEGNNSSTIGSGGSSSNSGNNSGGGNTEKPPVTPENSLINESKSKVLNIEGTGYAVVSLKKGDINSTKFSLNGQEVTPTAVDTEGTIVKFEVNPKEKIDIKATKENSSKDKVDTVTFNKDKDKSSRVINNESPDKVLASGPISVFDYHQTNYDKYGKVRFNPKKTTFDLGEKDYTNNTIPKLTSQKTKLGEDVVISYDTAHENAADWKEKIHSVEKFYSNGSTSAKLQYSLDEGKIIIKGTSTAIDGLNGKHIINIKATGYDDIKIQIETVKEAGKINLSPNYNYIAYSDLLFELEDFNYAIENPIYEVLLDGEKLQGDSVEYHIVSNLVTLENECKQKLTPGKHKISVKAHGYENFEREFILEDASRKGFNSKSSSSKTKSLDAITSASTGTGGGESGGGTVIRANLIYDFDLLSNAMILEKIGQETDESKAVLSWWSQVTKDAILIHESEKVLDYKNYKNSLNEALVSGEYMTFKEYYNKKSGDYVNKPYNVKYVLEDGLLGELQSYTQENLKFAPKTSIEEVDDNIVITFEESDKEYLEKIIDVYTTDYSILSKSKYSIEGNKITIKDTSEFNYGINKIKVTAEGYKDNKLEIDLSKENSDINIKRDKENNILVTLDKEIKQKFKGLDINGKALLSDSQSGGNKGDFYYDGDTIVLKSKLFINLDTQYTITATADGYKDTIATFIPSKLDEESLNLKEVPEYVKLNQVNTYKPNERVVIDVAKVFNNDYQNKIEEVLVNNNKVEFTNSSDNFYSIEVDGENFKLVGGYTITVKSSGYENFSTKVKIHGDKISVPNIEASKSVMGEYTFKSDAKYINDITDVKLNGKSMGSSEWSKQGDKVVLSASINSSDVITFESNNYENYVYTVPKKSVDSVGVSIISSGYYKFKHNESGWSKDVEVYLNGSLLSKDSDYITSDGEIVITKKLNLGDKLSVKSGKYVDYNYTVELLDNKVEIKYNSYNKNYSFNSSDSYWRDNITSVSINGSEINMTTDFQPTAGYKNNYSGGIDIYNSLTTNDEVVIESNGYKDYKIIIE